MLTTALASDPFGRLTKQWPTARQPENLSREGQLISRTDGAQLALRGWMIFLLEDYRAAGFFLSNAGENRAIVKYEVGDYGGALEARLRVFVRLS